MMHSPPLRARVPARALAALVAMLLAGGLVGCGGGGGSAAAASADAKALAGPGLQDDVTALAANAGVPGGRYVLVNVLSDKCVDAAPSGGDGGRLQQADCQPALTQVFDVSPDPAGGYRLTAAATGKVMDVAGGSSAEGAPLQQWRSNRTPAQRFLLTRTRGNRFSLVNAGSNKCVAVDGASTDSGAGLKQASCGGQAAQQFYFYPQSGTGRGAMAVGQYTLRSVHSSLCLQIEGAATVDGARLVQSACTDAGAQRFELQPEAGGAYRLASVHSGKSLDVDVDAGSLVNGAALQQWADVGAANQRFLVKAAGDALTLQPRHSAKCVDVAGFSMLEGGRIHQWDCTGNANQRWRFAPVDGLSTEPPPVGKSAKRGIAYDLASAADMAALSPGVSWWYNWSPRPGASVPADHLTRFGMDFMPMLWNGDFNDAEVEATLRANPRIRHLLLLNEPNLRDQANLTPAQAARLWPRYEALSARTGVKLVGPAITWGTVPGFEDPVVWLDAFYAAYRAANGNRDPQIDYLAFHWYDYGLSGQLDRLAKYRKPFWVTEFANWHGQNDGAQIDSIAKQKAQMTDMVATCENRADVVRYAWFTGRWDNDTHFSSLLGADGQLTELGRHYLALPYPH